MDSGGSLSGTAALPDGTVFATISGSVSGNVMTQTQTYNSFDLGYVATETGTVSADGKTMTGTWTSNAGQQGTFVASLVSGGPVTTTTTTTTTTMTTPTTTTTTTTTTPTKRASSTQVMCDYVLAVAQDTCTATVGDATGQGALPTGTVTFTSGNGGVFPVGARCNLSQQPGDVGVASCAAQFIPRDISAPLMITGTYSGDSTLASSNGSTQVLLAGVGNTVYVQTIGDFNPQTLNATVDNPTSNSTVSVDAAATADLTDAGVCVAENGDSATSASAASGTSAVAAATMLKVKSRAPKPPATVRVSMVRRHVAKGKLRVPLHMSLARLRKAFPRGGRVQIVVAVTIKPAHGSAVTIFRRKLVTLRWHGKRAARESGSVDASLTLAHESATTHVWSGTGCGTFTVSQTYAQGQSTAQVPVEVSWTDISALCFTGVGGAGGGGGVSVRLPNLLGHPLASLGTNGYTWTEKGQIGGQWTFNFVGTIAPHFGTVSGSVTANGIDNNGTPFACQAIPPSSLQQTR